MAYKLAPGVQCLVVYDESGRAVYHYQAAYSAVSRGPYIPWLNDVQRQHFLRLGLVEEVDDLAAVDEEAAPPAPDSAVNPDLVEECIRALDDAVLDDAALPSDAGAPTCRKALRDAGLRFSNDVIAAAVRERKMRAP